MMRVILALLWFSWVIPCSVSGPPAPNPSEPVDYVKWINDGFTSRVKDNGAALYLEAMSAISGKDVPRALPGDTDIRTWTDAQKAGVRQQLRECAVCLDKFCAAAHKAGCYFVLRSKSGALVEAMFPECLPLLDIGRLLAVRARIRLLQGEDETARNDVECLVRAGRHMQSQPDLVHALVGAYLYTFASDVVFEAPTLSARPLDYDRWFQSLAGGRLYPVPIVRQVIGERICVMDVAQRFLRDADGDGRHETLYPPKELDIDDGVVRLTTARTFDETVLDIERFYDRIQEAAAEGEYVRAKPQIHALQEALATKAREGSFLAVVSADQLIDAARLQYRVIASYRAACIVLQLHAFRARVGRWPRNLQDLSVARQSELLTDPFSGEPFRYRLRDQAPVLYSVGENGRDDGGEVVRRKGRATWAESGDYVFWPPQHE